jgi:DNA-binding transcriptional MerR regulator
MPLSRLSKIRAAQIARLRVAGRSISDIAKAMGMSTGALRLMLAHPEYRMIEEEVFAKHIAALDAELARRRELIRAQIATAVPSALRTLVDAMNQRRDLRAAIAAAKEILDRERELTAGREERSVPDLRYTAADAEAARKGERIN